MNLDMRSSALEPSRCAEADVVEVGNGQASVSGPRLARGGNATSRVQVKPSHHAALTLPEPA
jgi:hypothetical protein